MTGIFTKFDDAAFFSEFVQEQEKASQALVTRWFPDLKVDVDCDRITYAHGEYSQNIEKFSVLLHSKNPDHYKRAGALLHALYQSNIIVGVELGNGVYGTRDDLESGFTRVSFGDAEHVLKFVDFYNEYHNQILAFEIAYRACCSYEREPIKCNFDYLQNVCRYLKANTGLNVDSCFMLFKSLMAK